jgi:hypothetical protein
MDAREARQKLIASLIEVRTRWDAGADDWQHSLLLTFREYALAIGLEKELLHPIQKMLNDTDTEILKARRRKDGKAGTPMPAGKAMALSFAAAVVTTLKERGVYDSIGEAVRIVARRTGVAQKDIKNFRDNLNRHAFTGDVVRGYEEILAKLRQWPTTDLLKSQPLDKFVK